MKSYLTSSAMVLALTAAGTLGSATSAAAGNNAGALIVGALIGGAIVAGANQNRRNRGSGWSAQRTENAAVQTALNYFEFDAGGADGVFGRRTRAAVSEFQAFLGFPVTGELTTPQKDFLLSAHQRAEAGGADTSRILLQNGARALLVSYYDNPNGAPLGGSNLGNNDFGGSTLVNNDGDPSNDFGSDGGDSSVQPGGLPMFVTANESSMSAFCANGVTPQTPAAQFCSLRAFAIDDGDRLAATVQGASRADIQAQCEGFAPTMASVVQTAAYSGTQAVKDDLRQWLDSTGATPSSLVGIAKVCLGSGYETDNTEVALASILALVGAGEAGYQELLAYHLAFGFGFNGNEDRSRGAEWLESVSVAYARSDATIAGDDPASRVPLMVSMAGSLRGLPGFDQSQTREVVPVSNEDGGFFSSGD